MPEEDDLDNENPDDKDWIKELRQQAKEGKAAKAEAEAAKRELAFVQAGVPDSTLGNLFRKAYDGESYDPDHIKEEFAKLSPGTQTEAKSTEHPAEQDAAQRIFQASSGSTGTQQTKSARAIEFETAFAQASAQQDALMRQNPQKAAQMIQDVMTEYRDVTGWTGEVME